MPQTVTWKFPAFSHEFLGYPSLSLQKCVVNFWVKSDLKFEISDGKYLLKLLGEDFSTCHESTRNFGPNFGAKFGETNTETSLQIARLFSETSFGRRALLMKNLKSLHAVVSLGGGDQGNLDWGPSQSLCACDPQVALQNP